MPGKIKIYSKTGDDGTTGLVGGSRVKKYDLRLEAYGTVDELNSHIGLIRSCKISIANSEALLFIQNKLFNIGSRLASDIKGKEYTKSLSISDHDIEFLEKAIDRMEIDLPELSFFILPGGDTTVAFCHIARTVCRRAERRILEFSQSAEVDLEIIRFINRLSDFLFVLSRKIAKENNIQEIAWGH